MKLNWFSPLPPARTGIAQYTMGLLPTLERRAEIVLWTDQTEWDPLLEQYAVVRYYHPEQMPWAELNHSDMSIYHIGNNLSAHGSIWQVSRSHQGIVVLHDLSLQHLFAGLFRDHWHDRDGYLAHMERHYDWEGRLAAEAFWNGKLSTMYMSEHYPLTSLAVQGALGVLVHTQEGLVTQRQENACPVAYMPLPYAPTRRSYSSRSKLGGGQAGGPPYRIIIFGYLSVNRRVDSLLQALGTLPDGDLFRLDIYGQVWDREYVRTQIQTLGLQGLVKLHGFVPAEELDSALAAAHLAVNLRYPTMGESSFSQLQIWDHALPTLVSQVGWYAKLPENAVAFVRPEHEVLDIQRHLNAFLADPERFMEMGAQGRHFLEEHHRPEMYVEALIAFIADAQHFSPQAAAYELAIRVGTAMQAWSGLPTSRIVSQIRDQERGLCQQQNARQQQAATLEVIHKAVTSYVVQLRQQQTEVLEALQRAVSGQIEKLHQPSNRKLRMPLNDTRGGESPYLEVDTVGCDTRGENEKWPTFAFDPSTPEAVSKPLSDGKQPFRDASTPLEEGTARSHPLTASDKALGEGHTRDPYTREAAFRFPLSINGHDEGFRYLFDFMVVAKSLGLRPGAEVLDFGAGSCFVSELLNRLGYITVAFDLDPKILAIGQERLTLDSRCDPERAKFVTGDGTRLPFHDESFDGIMCMNALHHMPDYRATLSEMYRVLRPGGRAVFSEPGSEHSKSPEAISAMQEYGVLEKDVVLSEICKLAQELGFQRLILKPYVYPELVELDYEEFEQFRSGAKVSTPFLTRQEIGDFIEHSHSLFYLEKRGSRPLTSASAPPRLLRARLTLNEYSTHLRKGETIKLVVMCENTGQSLWLSKPKPYGGYVTFGVMIFSADGHLLDDSRGRQLLSEDVPPGGQIEVTSEVSLTGFDAGQYRLRIDMVNEQVTWFHHIGSEATEQPFEIA